MPDEMRAAGREDRRLLNRALLLLFGVYIVSNIYAASMAAYAGVFLGGDFDAFPVDRQVLLLNLLLVVGCYALFYVYFALHFQTAAGPRFHGPPAADPGRRAGRVGLMLLVIQGALLAAFAFGGLSVQRLEEEGPSFFTYYQALLVPDYLFLAYYPFGRRSRYFAANAAIYLLSTLYRGMLGGAAAFLFFEFGYALLTRRWRWMVVLVVAAVLAAPLLYGFRALIRSSSIEYLAQTPVIELVSVMLSELGGISGYLVKFGEAVHFILMRLQHVSSAAMMSSEVHHYLFGAYEGKFLFFFSEGRFQASLFGWASADAPRLSEYVMLNYFPSDFGTWDIQTGLVGWLWAEPLWFPVVVIYCLGLLHLGGYLYRLMKAGDYAIYCLWVAFLLFALHGWFAAFSNYVHALVVLALLVKGAGLVDAFRRTIVLAARGAPAHLAPGAR